MFRRVVKTLILVSSLILVAIALMVFFPILNPKSWKFQTQLSRIEDSIRDQKQPVFFSDLTNEPQSQIEVGNRVFELANNLKIPQEASELLWKVLNEQKQLTPEELQLVRDSTPFHEETLTQLAAIDGPSRFTYDFNTTNPSEILLPQVEQTGNISRIVFGRFLWALEGSDTDQAIRWISELFDTGDWLENDPFFVSQLIRVRCGQYGIVGIEKLIGRVALSENQFLLIDHKLADAERRFRLRNTVMVERAIVNTQFVQISKVSMYKLKNLFKGKEVFISGGFSFAPDVDAMWFPSGALDQRAWALETMGKQADLIDQMPWQAESQWQELESIEDDLTKDKKPIGDIYPGVSWVRNGGLSYRQRLVNARLALRVVRFYRTENNELPERLDQIVDETIRTSVQETWNGSLPQYHRSENGFEIFSSDFPKDDRTPTGVKVQLK